MQFEVAFEVLSDKIRLQTGISDAELAHLKTYFTVELVQKNAITSGLGQIERRLYFVSAGVLRAWFENDGEERTAAFIYEGFWGSSFGSFLSGTESPYEIQAVTDALLLCVTRSNLEEALSHCPKFAIYYRNLLQLVIVGMQSRERELMASDARSRFERFMSQSAFLLQHVPQKQIASYLNMSPETFSRMRRSMAVSS